MEDESGQKGASTRPGNIEFMKGVAYGNGYNQAGQKWGSAADSLLAVYRHWQPVGRRRFLAVPNNS